MANMVIGSARKNELGTYTTGKKGDQLQKASEDYSGEVSMQRFYVHKKGWYILRLKNTLFAKNIAKAMIDACNNSNVGYSQNDRLDIIKKGIRTNQLTNCDCSSLVRACLIDVTGIDVGNFTTLNEVAILKKSGLFYEPMPYANDSVLFDGDILVTKTQGHTAIVVYGNSRAIENKDKTEEYKASEYYPKYIGNSKSIYDALLAVGEKDASFYHRRQIAKVNGFANGEYIGDPEQNSKMLELLKEGKLKKG